MKANILFDYYTSAGTVASICKKHNTNRQAINQFLIQNGLPTRGKFLKAIAKKHSVQEQTVRLWRRKSTDRFVDELKQSGFLDNI